MGEHLVLRRRALSPGGLTLFSRYRLVGVVWVIALRHHAIVGTFAVGDILAGKYRVDRVLGEGGMGVVVAATHIELDERVALKFMLPEALKALNAKQRFLREARAAVKLKSEHVAKVLDVATLESGAPYIVMEYLEGMDVAATIARDGKLPATEACDYIIQVCDALSEAHGLGIVHRDLKPANLFVTRRPNGDPLVKVLDFGISKNTTLGEAADALTKSSVMLGSPLYMSPEQMKSSRDVDTRTDIWSLGVILYELLSGSVPFDGDTIGALMAKVLAESPRPLEGVQPELAAVVMRCLSRDPSGRFESVRELALAIAPLALPRSQVLVDRMRPVTPTPSKSELELAKTLEQPAAPVSANTGASWGGTAGDEAPRRRRAATPIVIALVALGAVAVAATLKLRGPADSSPGSPPVATSAPASLAETHPADAPPASSSAPSTQATVSVSTSGAGAFSTVPPSMRPAPASSTHVAHAGASGALSVAPSAASSGSATPKKKGPLDDWN